MGMTGLFTHRGNTQTGMKRITCKKKKTKHGSFIAEKIFIKAEIEILFREVLLDFRNK